MKKKKNDRAKDLNGIKPEEEAAAGAAMAAEEGSVSVDEKAEDAPAADKDPDAAQSAADIKPEEPQQEADAVSEWKEKYTRQLAEFDNFRKRTEKEKSQMYDYGVKAIAGKILPTIDNFERGLKGAPEGAFAEGMEMVYRQLLKNLEEAGVKAIDCVGKEFDPNIHNAVMHEEDDSGEENIVTEEFQKGYMYKETLLRPSMVKVKN